MQISKDIEILDLSLYLAKYKALIISDFHIGFEESLNKQGIMIPRLQFKDQIQKLDKIFEKIRPDTVIINGDVKHEFGRISEQEWKQTLKLIDYLAKKCLRLIMIKGNHDKVLGPIAEKKNIEITDNIVLGDILITHGHKLIKELKGIKTIIIGHEHPAIALKEGPKVELFKCFIKGKWKGKDLIVMPSFNLVTQGTDIMNEELLSPYLKQSLANFDCWIVEDKIYKFGKLKTL